MQAHIVLLSLQLRKRDSLLAPLMSRRPVVGPFSCFRTADVHPYECVGGKAPDSAVLLMSNHFLPWSVSGSVFKHKSKSFKWPWKAARFQKPREGRTWDKEAADRHDVHMQMNTEHFVHPSSLSLHQTLSIFPTEAFYIPHAATVAKQMLYFNIHSCRVTGLFLYLLESMNRSCFPMM